MRKFSLASAILSALAGSFLNMATRHVPAGTAKQTRAGRNAYHRKGRAFRAANTLAGDKLAQKAAMGTITTRGRGGFRVMGGKLVSA